MATYIPVFVWTFSAVICAYIAIKRGARATFMRSIIVALIGPFAIPLAFVVKPEESLHSE